MPRIAVVHVDPATMRSAALVAALGQRTQIVGVFQPRYGRSFDLFNKLIHFAPHRDTWRARAYFSRARFELYSRSIETQLADVTFDLVLHPYPIVFTAPHRTDFGIYTDNTMAVTQRLFPVWANLSPRERKRAIGSERDSFRAAQFVGVQSQQACASAIEDYGCSPDRVEILGQGVMVSIPPSYPERPANDPPTALFVGTTFARKGGDVLLDAWRTVARSLPSARLLIVGPKGRPPAGFPVSCRWIGPLSRDEITSLYATADVLVHPAPFEASLPNVIREAVVYGLPVVASDLPAIREGTAYPEWLFDPGDADMLAERLLRLLSNPELAEAVGRELYATRDRFDWGRLADRVLALAARTTRH